MDSSNDPYINPTSNMNFGSSSNQPQMSQDEVPNPFENFILKKVNQNLTPEEIEQASWDPKIVSIIEDMVKADLNKYFLELSQNGAKIPFGFDTSIIVEVTT